MTTCFEDQPCWDWQTMGNQLAGFPTNGLNVDAIVRALETENGFRFAL